MARTPLPDRASVRHTLSDLKARADQTATRDIAIDSVEQDTGKVWIDGKPIYRKHLSLGNLPNATTKSVNHNIPGLISILSVVGKANSALLPRSPLPHANGTIASNVGIDFPDATTIVIKTGIDYSGSAGSLILEYVRS